MAVSAIMWLRAIMALSHFIRPWFIRALSPAIMPWPIIAGFARWVVSAITWDWARAAGAARTTEATVKARIRIRRFQRERVGSTIGPAGFTGPGHERGGQRGSSPAPTPFCCGGQHYVGFLRIIPL